MVSPSSSPRTETRWPTLGTMVTFPSSRSSEAGNQAVMVFLSLQFVFCGSSVVVSTDLSVLLLGMEMGSVYASARTLEDVEFVVTGRQWNIRELRRAL